MMRHGRLADRQAVDQIADADCMGRRSQNGDDVEAVRITEGF